MKQILTTLLLTLCSLVVSAQSARLTKKEKPKTPVAVRVFYDSKSNSVVFGSNHYKMVYVTGGTFLMGATSEQGSDEFDDEKPTHRVALSDYYIGQTEVTQGLWRAVMEDNPSDLKGDNLPVVNVSWNDCQRFIEKLNSKTGRTFRLPSEAEWESASRGGNNSRGYKYSGSNDIDDVAWYTTNSNDKTHAVATKRSNELGLYDMSGNVWEWCNDWYDSNYNMSNVSNPRGVDTDPFRVIRGGSWDYDARDCRVSNRDYAAPADRSHDLGLRLVLIP